MKRKNYMLKFGLSMTLIILPILVIINAIIIVIRYTSKDNINTLLFDLLFFGLEIIVIFGITSLVGFIIYKLDLYLFTIDKDDTISNSRIILRKKDIIKIKARRFLFLYSYDIYSRPWGLFSSISIYFYNKDELIDFVNKNETLLSFIDIKYLKKLGIKN